MTTKWRTSSSWYRHHPLLQPFWRHPSLRDNSSHDRYLQQPVRCLASSPQRPQNHSPWHYVGYQSKAWVDEKDLTKLAFDTSSISSSRELWSLPGLLKWNIINDRECSQGGTYSLVTNYSELDFLTGCHQPSWTSLYVHLEIRLHRQPLKNEVRLAWK